MASRTEEPAVLRVHETDIYGPDIYTEAVGDIDTVANLGPLQPLAGIWEGTKGADQHPVAAGTGHDVFTEHYELHPIDFQTNGPQLFYGMRYHTHIRNPANNRHFTIRWATGSGSLRRGP
jgi:hypothetical protein